MRHFGCVLLLVFSVFSPAADTDTFRLSMENIHATIGSMKGLMQLLASDPQLRARFEAEKEKLEDTNGRDEVSLTAARLETAEPRIAAVYRKAGITPKQAGMTLETLIGVILGHAMLEASKTKADLPKGFVAENVAFYRQHKAEITKAMNELKALGRSLDTAGSSDEDDDGSSGYEVVVTGAILDSDPRQQRVSPPKPW